MSTTMTVILFIVALIFSVGFLLLVISLIPAINQLRFLLVDMEKTSVHIRELSIKLQELTVKIDRDVDKVDSILDSSTETMQAVSNTLRYVHHNILGQTARFLTFIPAIKMGWNFIKKIKGGKKHVK